MILGEPRAMRDVLRRLGAGQAFTCERLFDVLATTGECHHLFARIAVKLPSPVLSSDLDSISELLDFASQLGGGKRQLRSSVHGRSQPDRGRATLHPGD